MCVLSLKFTIVEYIDWLREQPCLVSGLWPVTLHHIVGGSTQERLGVRGNSKHSDWLQIPLHYDYHQGKFGIHTIGVKEWEDRYGRQVDMIDKLCQVSGFDLWELAKEKKQKKYKPPKKQVPREPLF